MTNWKLKLINTRWKLLATTASFAKRSFKYQQENQTKIGHSIGKSNKITPRYNLLATPPRCAIRSFKYRLET